MWTIFKVFIQFVTILLLFYVLVFWPQGMWNHSSPSNLQAPALEGKVLTTGPPGKSPLFFKILTLCHTCDELPCERIWWLKNSFLKKKQNKKILEEQNTLKLAEGRKKD